MSSANCFLISSVLRSGKPIIVFSVVAFLLFVACSSLACFFACGSRRSGLGRLVGLLDVEVEAYAQHHAEHDEDNQQDLQTLTFTGHEFVLLRTPAAAKSCRLA